MEDLLHSSTVPIQLQVQVTDLLKPGFGRQDNVLLPALRIFEPREHVTWQWPWKILKPAKSGLLCCCCGED